MRYLFPLNPYNQQRQFEKPVWVYPAHLAMYATYLKSKSHTVYWNGKPEYDEDEKPFVMVGFFKEYVDHVIKDDFQINVPFDKLPYPDRIFTDAKNKRWQSYGNYKYHPATHMMASNLCWWGKCLFCIDTAKLEAGEKRGVRPVDHVLEEIDDLIRLGFKEVFDDSGTFPIGEWLQEFCTKMIKSGRNKKIVVGCNMKPIAERVVPFKLMKEAGFRFILVGVESANQKTIDLIRKGQDNSRVIENLKAMNNAGLEVHLTSMFGYEWESHEEAMNTVRLVHHLLKKGIVKTAQASVYSPPRTAPNPDSTGHKYIPMIYEAYRSPEFWYRKITGIKRWEDFTYLIRGGRLVMEEYLRKMKFLLIALFLCTSAYAEPVEVVSVGAMQPIEQSQLGKDVSVLDSTILEDSMEPMLMDVIHNVPGVHVKHYGLSTIRIRGSRSIDTRVLMSRFPLRDPSDTQDSSNPLIGDLLAHGLNSVEILKGPASTLYGSQAIGGVINLEPKCCAPNKAFAEYGEEGSFREGFDYRIGPIFSSFERLDGPQDYQNTSIRETGYFKAGDFVFEPLFYYQKVDARLRNAPFIQSGELVPDNPDENDRRSTRYYLGGLKTKFHNLQNETSYSYSNRRFEFLPNEDMSGFYQDGHFKGESFTTTNQYELPYGLTAGHTYVHDFLTIKNNSGSMRKDQWRSDLFLEERFEVGELDGLLGVRLNTQENSKDRVTYDAAFSYPIGPTVLKTHVGTGFRSASLFERYGAFLTEFGTFDVGNPLLGPERSFEYDFGHETLIGDVSLGQTYFHQDLSNAIDLIGPMYINVDGKKETYGVENYVEWNGIRLSYTQTLGDRLLEIPRHEVGASYRKVIGGTTLYLRGTHQSEHQIAAFNMDTFMVDRIAEDGLFTTDLTVKHKLSKKVTGFIRIKNLFDEDYAEGGYQAENFRVYGGVEIEL